MLRSKRAIALAVAAFLVLAACGDTDADTSDTTAAGDMTEMTDGEMTDTNEMGDMDEMNMGDPDATPAYEVEGAELSTGAFELLDTRPPGTNSVEGTAWLARHDGGTTVTIEVSGLEPGVEYISHVHAEPCSPNNGGPHYQFEEGGSVMPPNEIHLLFTADDSGMGSLTAENDMTVDDRARAVVVHPADLIDNKIACADL